MATLLGRNVTSVTNERRIDNSWYTKQRSLEYKETSEQYDILSPEDALRLSSREYFTAP